MEVNGEVQVRFLKSQQEQIVEFLTQGQPEPVVQEDTGVFYLIRQRKDNPLKLKVMFANTSSAKLFTTRAAADAHQKRMTEQHGAKFTFFVVKEVK